LAVTTTEEVKAKLTASLELGGELAALILA
jgi:hypothetical protein